MSAVTETVDLTMYGCPMHYIKAREALKKLNAEESLSLIVNSGNPVNEVMKSLRKDGQECEITSEEILTTIIKVTKKND